MQQLTPEGHRIVTEFAERYNFSADAVKHMMFAVLNGNGTMAQFNHPEFAGSGQWMQGGMIMLGDMFNHTLKSRVDGLCNDISVLLANQSDLLRSGSFQSQNQSGDVEQSQVSGVSAGNSSLFVPDPSERWYPIELGAPNSTGSQNNIRYAYFADARRLAVNIDGNVRIYDTLDHQIGGFSQQQGMGTSVIFTSQHGMVNLTSLPVVSQTDPQVPSPQPEPLKSTLPPSVNQSIPSSTASQPSRTEADSADILDTIARLGELKDKGILTEEEFTAKKAELLARL